MKEKIKNLFEFFKSAWTTSSRGKIGIILMLVAIIFFAQLFYGTRNLQGFIINAWRLNRERTELAVAKKQLGQLQHHVYLLKHPDSSSDYIEELGLKTLNMGDADFKELKY